MESATPCLKTKQLQQFESLKIKTYAGLIHSKVIDVYILTSPFINVGRNKQQTEKKNVRFSHLMY